MNLCHAVLLDSAMHSARAYAAVVCMNIVSSEGCVTRFVASKTRVAPLSAQTIPRLDC